MLPPKGQKRWGLWLFLSSTLVACAALAVFYFSIYESGRVKEFKRAEEICNTLLSRRFASAEFRENVEQALVLANTAQGKVDGVELALLRSRLCALKLDYGSALDILSALPQKTPDVWKEYAWFQFMRWGQLYCQKVLDAVERREASEIATRTIEALNAQPDLMSRAILAAVKDQTKEAIEIAQQLTPGYRPELLRAVILLRHGDYAGGIEHAQSAVKLSPNALEAQLFEAALIRLSGDAKSAEEKFKILLEYAPSYGHGYYVMGLVRVQLERADDALQDFQRSQLIDPGWKPAALAMACVHDGKGRYDAALGILDGLVKDETYLEAWQERARTLRKAGRNEEAIAAITAMLAKFPETRSSRAYVDRAELELLVSRPQDALISLEAGKGLEPDSLRVRRMLVDVLEKLELTDRWFKEISETLAQFPEGDLLFKRAKNFFNRKKFRECAADLTDALKAGVENKVDVLLLRARAGEALETFEAALTDYDQVIRLSEKPRLEAHRGRGMVNFKIGKFELASADLMAVVMLDPSDTEACERVADAFRSQAKPDLEQAITFYTRAIARGRESAGLFRKRGQCRFSTKDYAGAAEDLQKSIAQGPEASTEVLLGRSLIMLGKHREAFAPLDAAVRRDPANVEAVFYRGMVRHFTRGESAQAVEDISRAIGQGYINADAFVLRAMCYQALGDLDKAIDDTTSALRLAKTNAPALRLRAKLQGAAGRFESALADVDAVLASYPDDAEILTDRSELLLKLGRFDEALKGASRALKNPRACAVAAFVEEHQGRRGPAILRMQHALELDPGRTDWWCQLAGWQFAESHLVEAKEAIRKALGGAESYQTAYLAGRIFVQSEEFSEAAKYLSRAIELNAKAGEPYLYRAMAYMHLEDYVHAKQDLAVALQKLPDRRELIEYFQELCGSLGDY